MSSNNKTIAEFIEELPEERKKPIKKLRSVIKKNLPKGFKERMIYGMLGYVVPLSRYPDGYHCDPKLPLTFINIGSQKNYIAIYHSGVYGDPKLSKWLVQEFPKYSKRKLDMGKSCIRFKKVDEIPYDLIAELVTKMSVEEYISIYEKNIKTK